MNETVSRLLDAWRDEYARKLAEWVKIPSVEAEAEDGAPFGREVRHMLDTAEADAKAMGFPVRDFDGYACDITLGSRPEMIAVLGHLDVVPAGDGWNYPPFGAVTEGNRMYGRGTSDDKGPALASLYAMRAIKEAGVPLKRSIRLILGCNEETEWKDMEWYAAHAEIPAVGFSPDASFPVINTEKAILQTCFSAPAAAEGLQVVEMATGERPNVIPGESTAVVRGGEELAVKVRAWGLAKNLPVTAETVPEGVKITAEGIPGHSAYPEGRRNAIGMMLCLLRDLGAEGPVKTLADAVGMTHDGSGLGCACSDAVSGPLTCNMGILHLKDGVWSGTLDMRCPVDADLAALRDAAKAHLPGFELETLEMKEAHHVPADSELVTQLLAAYEEESGLPGEAVATGGGTYAKVLAQGVAFGAAFPDDEDLAHQANEYIDIDRMITAAKIYANALIRLAGE